MRARVEAVVLASGTRKVLVEDCADARYLPTGHVVCARQGVLVAAPSDVGRLEVTGPVVPVVQGVAQALNTGAGGEDSGAAQVAVSASGLLAYAPGGISEDPPGELLLVDEAGRAEPLPGFDRFEDRQAVPFLATPANERYPEFSPDGRWLAYASNESDRHEISVTSYPDRKQTLVVSREGGAEPAWSRDGRRLFYRSYAEKWMLEVPVRLGETLTLGRARRAFPTPFAEQGPARGYDLLPGGRRFLFTRYARWEPGPPTTRLNLVHNWFAELERLCPTWR